MHANLNPKLCDTSQVDSVCQHGNHGCGVGMPDPAVAVPSVDGGCQMPCPVQGMQQRSQAYTLQGNIAKRLCAIQEKLQLAALHFGHNLRGIRMVC